MVTKRDHHASRYHLASKMLSAAEEWEWGHSHTCPDCTETFYCNQSGCKTGPQTCHTCEDIQTVETSEGYNDEVLEPTDLALLDL